MNINYQKRMNKWQRDDFGLFSPGMNAVIVDISQTEWLTEVFLIQSEAEWGWRVHVKQSFGSFYGLHGVFLPTLKGLHYSQKQTHPTLSKFHPNTYSKSWSWS